MHDKVCIECRWCDLCIDFDSGSCYVCARTGEPQAPGAVIHKPACPDFEAPVPSPNWGP